MIGDDGRDDEKDIARSKAKTLMEFSKISSNYILFHGVGSKNLTIWETRKWGKRTANYSISVIYSIFIKCYE